RTVWPWLGASVVGGAESVKGEGHRSCLSAGPILAVHLLRRCLPPRLRLRRRARLQDVLNRVLEGHRTRELHEEIGLALGFLRHHSFLGAGSKPPSCLGASNSSTTFTTSYSVLSPSGPICGVDFRMTLSRSPLPNVRC